MSQLNEISKYVRPIATIIFVIGINVGFFLKFIDSQTYVPIATLAIGYYFNSREKTKTSPGQKA
jgi:hypothetical protein